MTSVAAQPLSLVFVGSGPCKTPFHFGPHLGGVSDYRDVIAALTVAEKGVLRAMAQAIVEATGGDS